MKINIVIRFYAELNDWLKSDIHQQDIFIETENETPVGSLIENFGLPCSFVDLILVNGRSVGFDYLVNNNDRISVYPVFERMNIVSISMLKQSPLRRLSFICDVHLGRLAKYLRILGFDTVYNNDYDKNRLIRVSNSENRILLSRSESLINNKQLTRRCLVVSADPEEQVRKIISDFDLKNDMAPMTRCLKCNARIQTVEKEATLDPAVRNVHELNSEFSKCPGCGKIYWRGSHYESMRTWIHHILD